MSYASQKTAFCVFLFVHLQVYHHYLHPSSQFKLHYTKNQEPKNLVSASILQIALKSQASLSLSHPTLCNGGMGPCPCPCGPLQQILLLWFSSSKNWSFSQEGCSLGPTNKKGCSSVIRSAPKVTGYRQEVGRV